MASPDIGFGFAHNEDLPSEQDLIDELKKLREDEDPVPILMQWVDAQLDALEGTPKEKMEQLFVIQGKIRLAHLKVLSALEQEQAKLAESVLRTRPAKKGRTNE